MINSTVMAIELFFGYLAAAIIARTAKINSAGIQRLERLLMTKLEKRYSKILVKTGAPA